MAKPTPAPIERLLVTELWGLGDLALAMPFLQTAARHTQVTLLAKAYAAPLLNRFAPEVELIEFDAPWTAFKGKYRLHRWPWRKIRQTRHEIKARHFSAAVSARPDLREHIFLRLTGTKKLIGFPHAGSGMLLDQTLTIPSNPHRTTKWQTLAAHLGWSYPSPTDRPGPGRHVVLHTGASHPVRRWPAERYSQIAAKLQAAGWTVTLIDESQGDLDTLINTLATADRFIGNDSGPGHIAALLGVPTFTIFSSQLPDNFSPQHPRAAWIDGAPCRYKPCSDYCRFAEPHCLLGVSVESVWSMLEAWLAAD